MGWPMKLFRREVIGCGSPLMTRWIVIDLWGVGVRVHRFHRSDADRDLHDHPFSFLSIVLRGGYLEERRYDDLSERQRARWLGSGWISLLASERSPGDLRTIERVVRWFGPGSILVRPATTRHRVLLPEGVEAWTLVFTGPRVRDWGFWTDAGWVHWREFVGGKGGGA